MTLVASEISRHGIVMVGDSAITCCDDNGIPCGAIGGAAKVHYSQVANVGFSLWGNADVNGQQLDEWVEDFIRAQIRSDIGLENLGELLAEHLHQDLRRDGRPWDELKCGVHVAGYYRGLPRLWHVHRGHAGEQPHEPRLYRDYPEGRGWSDDYFRMVMLGEGGTMSCHLRGGYVPHYSLLLDHAVNYANSLRESTGVAFPQDSLRGHLEFQRVLIRFVAGVLVAAEEHPGVNDTLSAVAFTEDGVQHDELLPTTQWGVGRRSEGLVRFVFAVPERVRLAALRMGSREGPEVAFWEA